MPAAENLTKQYIIASGLVTNEFYMFMMEYAAVMGTVIAFIGMIANIIIIRTFIAMGVKDGVTVSFLALAIFDLAYLIAGISLGVTVTFYVTELRSMKLFPIEPYGMSIYFTHVMILINITNVLTTTFLAVARSMCVARPLQFKNTFTRGRAIMCMAAFAVFATAIYTPIFTNMGMSNKINKLTNVSRLSWWGSAVRESVKEMVWMMTDMVLPVASEFIITICVVIMSNSLRASSRFRQASGAVIRKRNIKHIVNTNSKYMATIPDSKVKNIIVDKLVGKDIKVVQQVVLISGVYVICNLPKILIFLITSIEPEFSIGGRYVKLYLSTNGFRKHFEVLNSAVNLIIYYKYNTKFRITLSGRVK